MRRTPLVAFQTALYEHFRKYKAPICDDSPEVGATPHIEIGEYTCEPTGTKDTGSQEVTYTLHVYSVQRGKAEINRWLDAMTAIIENDPIQISEGFSVLHCWVGFYEAFRVETDDGKFAYHHGAMRVHAKIQDTSEGKIDLSLPWL